jgi:hypothetical protein
MSVGVPTPSVIHLLTIFRQITAGELRIPAFQRGFVWRNDQIIALLESVKAGFPVGSILIWRVDRPILKIAADSSNSFPDIAETYPCDFVLDGMQRLSSLYGVFHFGESTNDPRFDVWYDLRGRSFYHADDSLLIGDTGSVPLAALFSPRRLLEFQSRFASMKDGDDLLDSLVELQGAFQDYMLPVVQIRGDDVPSVVNVFERVNSTGTLLSRVDFMRAITWDRNFDLSKSLDRASSSLEEEGFEIADETLIKCLALQLGVSPSGDALLTLRNKPPRELLKGFEALIPNMKRVVSYARAWLNIFSGDYIPYEGQLLVLFKAVGLGEAKSDEEYTDLSRWFWATSFNESLRGKPDHYVTRAVEDWRGTIRGRIRGLEPRLKITEADFIERRMIRGKALSTAFACMFAYNGAESLSGNYELEPVFYLQDGETAAFKHIVPQHVLLKYQLAKEFSGRVFSNLVIELESSPASDIMRIASYIVSLAEREDEARLRSQFLTVDLVQSLLGEDYDEFMWGRASLMMDCARQMVEAGGFRRPI